MELEIREKLNVDINSFKIPEEYIEAVNVDTHVRFLHKNDFYGLCLKLGIPNKIIPLTKKINNLREYSEYSGLMETIKVIRPEYSEVL